jgi:hypothetical protein
LAIPLGAITTVVVIPRWMARPLPWRPGVSGVLLMAAAVAGQVTIQRTSWPTPAAPPVLNAVVVAAAGLGGAVWVGGSATRLTLRLVRSAGLLSVALALGMLVIRAPTSQLRKAILVHGGVERLLIRGLLWPLAGELRFGPSSFWRGDSWTSTANASQGSTDDVSIDGHTIRFDGEASPRVALTPMKRSAVWIVVDTVRSDTLGAALATHPDLRNAYADFTWYQNFRSCSTMTKMVLAQVLGAPREGASGFVEDLNRAGYETARFGVYPDYSPPGFSLSTPAESDAATLGRLKNWLTVQRGGARSVFALVHLKGGHEPLQAPGPTVRGRYEVAVVSSFAAISKIVPGIPTNWVVVVSGDHGEAFGEHGLSNHANSLYDELLKTPVLVRGHGASPGPDDELLGCPEMVLKMRRALGGMPYVRDQAPYQLAFFENHVGFPVDTQAALTIGKYKSIWNIGANTWELYDLSRDSKERTDLFETSPDVARSFMHAFHLAKSARRLE